MHVSHTVRAVLLFSSKIVTRFKRFFRNAIFATSISRFPPSNGKFDCASKKRRTGAVFRSSSAQAKCYFAQTVRAILLFSLKIAPVLVFFLDFAFYRRKYVDFNEEILGCIVKTLYRCIIPISECLGKVCFSQTVRTVLLFSRRLDFRENLMRNLFRGFGKFEGATVAHRYSVFDCFS